MLGEPSAAEYGFVERALYRLEHARICECHRRCFDGAEVVFKTPEAPLGAYEDLGGVTLADLSTPLNVCLAMNLGGSVMLARFSQATWRHSLRSQFVPFPRMLRFDGALLENRELATTRSSDAASETYYGIASGDRLVHAWKRDRGREPDATLRWFFATAKSVHFQRRYRWRVVLGHSEGVTVSLTTDPTGASEVFRLRDVPPGKTRRAALLHWVERHWRRTRSDPTVERSVRASLRGCASFVWNGLKCEITPSEYDSERLALEAEREAEVRIRGRVSK